MDKVVHEWKLKKVFQMFFMDWQNISLDFAFEKLIFGHSSDTLKNDNEVDHIYESDQNDHALSFDLKTIFNHFKASDFCQAQLLLISAQNSLSSSLTLK